MITNHLRRRHQPVLGVASLVVAATLALTGCSSNTNSNSGSKNGSTAKITITAQLPPNRGTIDSKEDKALKQYTQEYEKKHPNVTVNWQPNTFTEISKANAKLVTEAAGGAAPDVVWEQYNPLLSGSIPQGILQDLRPWLNKPNPYIKGNKKWLDTFTSSTIPYMTSPDGSMQILLGSNIETAFFYNKADFSKTGITSTPKSWAEFVADLKKLKSAGFTPLMFASGAACNPSWFERLASTQFLNSSLSKFMVDKQPVTSGKDVASGIEKGVISMNNPAYAQVWKTLYDLRPYLAKGGSSYGACANPNTTSPPLSPQPLFVQGKVAMFWGHSEMIPQVNQAGFQGKFGLFAEPPITSSTSQYAAGLDTRGVIGGPNGAGQWSITSQKADKSMTPQKTDVVMDFMAWLFAPQHLGPEVQDWTSGGDIPTVKGAKHADVPGLESLLPPSKPPTICDIALDDVLSTKTTAAGLRLIPQLLNGNISFDDFSTKWQQLLQSGAEAWATQNHVDLKSLK